MFINVEKGKVISFEIRINKKFKDGQFKLKYD